MPDSALDHALRYAKMGLAVFPLRKRSKAPATPNGFHDGSAVPAVVKGWWGAEPDYGVGLVIPDWMVVVDVDLVGQKSLDVHGKALPDTVKVRTARGFHHYYELPDGFTKETAKRKIGYLPDVDLLVNGYVLAPPTRHPSGQAYSWVDGEPKGRGDFERCPDWVLVALYEERDNKDGLTDEDFIDGIEQGHRQEYLFRRACRMCRLGNSRGEAKSVLRALADKSAFTDDDTDKMVDRVYKTYSDADAAKRQREEQFEEKVWGLNDLLHETTEPPNYLIDKVLPGTGYSILFAAQGVGKSILADQMAVSIATGTKFLGRDCRRAGALVLDVEQDPAGASDRWRKLLGGLALDNAPANLYTSFSWPPMAHGGFEKLGQFLSDHPHVQLVVIDTLVQLSSDDDEIGTSYFKDGRAMSRFTRFANEYGIAFLLVHHSRKSGKDAPDSFADMASGTRGITGPAKARLGLVRADNEDAGVLHIGGKLPESKINLTLDRDFLVWR